MILKGINVVELASVLAGPSVGTFLAEWGAEVIKIESKKGDVTRSWLGIGEVQKEDKLSAYFNSVNRGKKSIALDYDLKQDFDLLIQYLKEADIIISSFKKGDDIKFGIDYQSIKQINPKVIYASISGFGLDSDRVAYDAVLQAESGYMYLNGKDKNDSNKFPFAIIDVLAAHQLKEAILLALLKRNQSGEGSYVTVSLADAAISGLINQGSTYLETGQNPEPQGSLHPNIAPYGEQFVYYNRRFELKKVYYSKRFEGKKGYYNIPFVSNLPSSRKGKFILAIGSDKQFETLLNILQLPKDDRFTTNRLRLLNRKDLFEFLQKGINQINIEELETSFLKHQIPFGYIKTIKEVMDNALTKKTYLFHNQIDMHSVTSVKQSVFKGLESSENLDVVKFHCKN